MLREFAKQRFFCSSNLYFPMMNEMLGLHDQTPQVELHDCEGSLTSEATKICSRTCAYWYGLTQEGKVRCAVPTSFGLVGEGDMYRRKQKSGEPAEQKWYRSCCYDTLASTLSKQRQPPAFRIQWCDPTFRGQSTLGRTCPRSKRGVCTDYVCRKKWSEFWQIGESNGKPQYATADGHAKISWVSNTIKQQRYYELKWSGVLDGGDDVYDKRVGQFVNDRFGTFELRNGNPHADGSFDLAWTFHSEQINKGMGVFDALFNDPPLLQGIVIVDDW
eukprot:TRINITY_DN27794_c0_g1_i2.p1 TRINITY_DN27794_c0_g1~~TRINITY_DN27794_c0_g1_i2.p1  ORF type:complete len:274 (+),score=31.26 TRINITY_DN27794_c0_g1_i2:114-935(+)